MANALMTGERPDPSLVGTGMARKSADLASLYRQRTEAAARDDWDEVDRITLEIKRIKEQEKGKG